MLECHRFGCIQPDGLPYVGRADENGRTLREDVIAMTTFVVESMDEVLRTGRKLRAAIGDPDRYAYATEQLAVDLESRLDQFDALPEQRFAPAGGGDAVSTAGQDTDAAETAIDELFATVASQLQLANLAAAAGKLADDGDIATLDAVLDDFAVTGTLLRHHDAIDPAQQRFDAIATNSPDLPTAVGTLTASCDEALDVITTESVGATSKSVTTLGALVPKVGQAWDWIEKNVPDQLTEAIGRAANRFAVLALRFLRSALDQLHRLVPLSLIATARDKVEQLRDRLGRHEAPAAVLGWLIDVEGCRQAVATALAAQDLAVARIDEATERLRRLTKQYRSIMQLAGGVGTAATGIAGAAGWLGLTVPQVGLAVVAANTLLVAAVLLIASDYVDSGVQLHVVKGIRRIVGQAVG